MKELWAAVLKDMMHEPDSKYWTADALDVSVSTMDAMERAGYVKHVHGTASVYGRKRGNWWRLTDKAKQEVTA